MKTQITLSQAIDGYLLDIRARQLSPRTITDYEHILRRFLDHIGDVPIAAIVADDVRHFLTDLGKHRIKPNGVAPRPTRRLSKKTIRNHYIAPSSLWTWAVGENIASAHVVRAIDPPTPEQHAIEPFTRDDVELLLPACEYTESYTRPGKAECANHRPTAERDRALLLLLIDTGARASEICAEPRKGVPGLRIADVDLCNNEIRVLGKGDQERILSISPQTAKALWRYLATRPEASPGDPVFMPQAGGALTTAGLLCLVNCLGERAGVSKIPAAAPHPSPTGGYVLSMCANCRDFSTPGSVWP